MCLIDFVIVYNFRCGRVYSCSAQKVNPFSSAALTEWSLGDEAAFRRTWRD
ncbi:hypothetical protein AWT69_003483 [Pseudomonas putida]|nr:hypothetical protein AWT69_003483 [Pseudomonas putida]